MRTAFPVMLVAGAFAAAGWSWWGTAAEPVPAQMSLPSHAPAAAVAAPRRAVASASRVPGTPPGPLATLADPSVRAAASLLTQAADARARGDLRATLALLQGAVARASTVETHAALGGLYLELGATGPAESNLRSAVEGDPGNADRWIALANALALKPDPMGVAGSLDRARAAMPGVQIMRNADGWLVREPTS